MISVYDKNGQIEHNNFLTAKLIILVRPTSNELNEIEKAIGCDHDIFAKEFSATEVSHFNSLPNCKLKDAQIFVSFNFDPSQSQVEDAIYPTIAVFNSQQLILVLQKTPAPTLEDPKAIANLSVENLLIKQLFYQNQCFNKELNKIKQQLDHLDRAARTTTKTKSLKEATDLTRTLVYFNHTMDDQASSIKSLIDVFKENKSINSNLVIDLLLSQRRLTKKIKVYRDLLESINGLFSAMMDNHLNNLMKYLDSIALIISIPALISGIWGMNVGGLPGKENELGFLWVTLFGAGLAIISALLLRKKNYLK